MTFEEVLLQTAANREFVREFDRLTGCSLSKLGGRSPLDAMIDDATGRTEAEVGQFVAVVFDVVWMRLPLEVRVAG